MTSENQAEVRPDLSHEALVGYPSLLVAGADEVGRGCLAGPVVAAALILPLLINFAQTPWLLEVQDSKKLTPEVRERLAPQLQKWAMASSIGVASVDEIDQINIHHASHLAIRRAIEALPLRPNHVLIDGKWIPKGIQIPSTAIVKGDLKCLSIAAASIIAKVWRDQQMMELDRQFPQYGFASHKGYPTPAHKEALRKNGVSKYHRRSFGPVGSLLSV